MANPVTSILGPDGERVLLYYVTEKGQLALSEVPVISSSQALLYEDFDTPDGRVALEQCIQAVTLRGIPMVYGWILRDSKKVLAKLSPITNFLDTKTKQNRSMTTTVPSFAAATDGQSKVYLYFLKKPTEDADPLLYETVQTWESTNTTQVSDESIKTSANSRLAVTYDPKSGVEHSRIIFFQQQSNNDNKLYWVTLTDSGIKSPASISGTQNARDGTPITVTRDEEGTLWLYWMSSQNDLQRATKRPDGEWEVTTGGIQNISKQRLATSSQISVTQTNSGGSKQNHVFYIEAGGYEYLDHVDTGV